MNDNKMPDAWNHGQIVNMVSDERIKAHYNSVTKKVIENNFARFYNHGFYSDKNYIDYDNDDLKTKNEANMYAQLLIDYNIETKDKTILDIGCGLGFGSNLLKKYFNFKQIDALDFIEANIDFAKTNFKDIDFLLYDAKKLNKLERKYDLIISVESLGYYSYVTDFYSGLYNNLNDNGKILIATVVAGNDKIARDNLEFYLNQFKTNKLRVIDYKDITPNVIKSCEYYINNCDTLFADCDSNFAQFYFRVIVDKYVAYKLGIIKYYNFCIEKYV